MNKNQSIKSRIILTVIKMIKESEDSHKPCACKDISKKLKISRATFFRILNTLRNDFKMEIEFYCNGYIIYDYGIFNEKKF